jgi:hypothetical protein
MFDQPRLRVSVWGNFALTQTDDEHPIARRFHADATAAETEATASRASALGFAPFRDR